MWRASRGKHLASVVPRRHTARQYLWADDSSSQFDLACVRSQSLHLSFIWRGLHARACLTRAINYPAAWNPNNRRGDTPAIIETDEALSGNAVARLVLHHTSEARLPGILAPPPLPAFARIYVLSGAIGSYFIDAVAADAPWHIVCVWNVNVTQTMTKPLSVLPEESKTNASHFLKKNLRYERFHYSCVENEVCEKL